MQRRTAPAATGAPDGRDFASVVFCLARNAGHVGGLTSLAIEHFLTRPRVETVCRAAVAAASTMDAGFVDNLSWRGVIGEILAMTANRTILGRIAGKMRRVPFNTPTLVESAPADAHWVAQRAPKPLSAFSLATATLQPSKIVAMPVFTQELFRELSPATESSIVNSVAASLAKFADEALLDPTLAAVTGGNPASLTYGITDVTSTGSTAAQITADLRAMLQRMIVAGSDLSGVTIVVHPTTALYLAGLLTAGGDEHAFPDMGATGGEIWGIEVLTSLACGDWGSPTARQIVAVDSRRILLADDGRVAMDMSREASLQMLDNPSAGAAQMVSLWELNMVSLRIERYISWQRADANAVQVISGVTY